MIEVSDLKKSFGDAEVLKGISATFEPGKTNLIIGASGSGKTTLCKCIVGLHEPTAGGVAYDAADFTSMNFFERRVIRNQIGFLFQGSALFDFYTVEENVGFALRMFTEMTSQERLERINFCLERVNLAGTNQLMPSELSGGMRKRVGIARAIAVRPKYLFCDEPNSGLDPQTSVIIDQLIQELTREYNMTTVVITHDMNSVIEIGDRVMFIHEGHKWWEGNKESILDTDNQEVLDFVYASPYMKELRKGS